jgi:hypothetical protein
VRGARGPALGVACTGANGGLGSDFRSGNDRGRRIRGIGARINARLDLPPSGSRYFIAAASGHIHSLESRLMLRGLRNEEEAPRAAVDRR